MYLGTRMTLRLHITIKRKQISLDVLWKHKYEFLQFTFHGKIETERSLWQRIMPRLRNLRELFHCTSTDLFTPAVSTASCLPTSTVGLYRKKRRQIYRKAKIEELWVFVFKTKYKYALFIKISFSDNRVEYKRF